MVVVCMFVCLFVFEMPGRLRITEFSSSYVSSGFNSGQNSYSTIPLLRLDEQQNNEQNSVQTVK